MANKRGRASVLTTEDSTRVEESVVRAEPKPTFTKTWRPYSHAEVLDAVGEACRKMKLGIVRKEYSIRKNSQMFAVWEIDRGEEEFNFGIGIVNSIDKTCSIRLCAGERVFICDNFVFRGEFVLHRKHTGGLEIDEIIKLAHKALEALMQSLNELRQWHEEMKSVGLTAAQASLLTVAAMAKSLIPPSKFLKFYELYLGYETKYSQTLHGWHGAVTELMNSNSLLTISQKQKKLNRFIDYEVHKILEYGTKDKIDFFKLKEM